MDCEWSEEGGKRTRVAPATREAAEKLKGDYFDAAPVLCLETKCSGREDGECLFDASHAPETTPVRVKQFCVQVDMPIVGTPLQLRFGINSEWRTGADCFADADDSGAAGEGGTGADKACYMAVKGEVGIGVGYAFPGVHGSIYVTGSIEIETMYGKKCPPFVVGNPLPTEKCGHWRLIKAWVTNYFATSGMLTSKEFTAAMFSSSTKNQAELKAETASMEDHSALMEIINAATPEEGEAELPFPPKKHPFFKMGSVWNTQFHEYWVKDILQGLLKWKNEPVLAQRMWTNRDTYNNHQQGQGRGQALPPKEFLTIDAALEYKDTLDRMAGSFGVDKVKKKLVNFGIKLTELVNKKDAKAIRRLFVWFVRYVMETSLLQYLFGNPAKASKDKGKRTLWNEDSDPTLSLCGTLPVVFDGVIKGADNRGTEYGLLKEGQTEYLYQGKSRLLCTLGKDIATVRGDAHGGYDRVGFEAEEPGPQSGDGLDGMSFASRFGRFRRKLCRGKATDSTRCGVAEPGRPADDDFSCRHCPDPETGPPVVPCELILQTAAVGGHCPLNGGSTNNQPVKPSDFYSGEEMTYQIPLFSANVFPTIVVKAVETMNKMRSRILAQNADKLAKCMQDFMVWLETAKTHREIKENWNRAFAVLKQEGAENVCRNGQRCSRAEMRTLFPGKMYMKTGEYVRQIHEASIAAAASIGAMQTTLKYDEPIEWTASLALSATFGFTNLFALGSDVSLGSVADGGVGFCTPDFQQIQVTAPSRSVSGTVDLLGKLSDNYGAEDKNVQVGATNTGVSSGHFSWGTGEKGWSVYLQLTSNLGVGIEAYYDFSTRSLGYRGFVRLYLPRNEISVDQTEGVQMGTGATGDGAVPAEMAMVSAVVPVVIEFATFLKRNVPSAAKRYDDCGIKCIKKDMLMLRDRMSASLVPLFATLGFATMGQSLLTTLTKGKSLMSVLSGSSIKNYVWLEIGVDYARETPKGKRHLYFTAMASFLNILEVAIGLPGLALKPMAGLGTEYDVGALINDHLTVTYGGDNANGDVANNIEAAVLDTRNPRCKECCRQIDLLLSRGKDTDCGTGDRSTDEARAMCKFVKADVGEFLGSNVKVKSLFGISSSKVKASKAFKEYMAKHDEANAPAACVDNAAPFCQAKQICQR